MCTKNEAEKLTLSEIPSPDAPASEVIEFAVSFNGYEYCGSLEACAELANSGELHSLNDLRAALFFEQRRLHFSSNCFTSSSDELVRMREYISKIREIISAEAS